MDGWIILLLAFCALLIADGIWQMHAEHRRMLSPHELSLRRASHPVGVAALALLTIMVFGARGVGNGVASLLPYPADNRLQAALLAVPLLYVLVSFVIGARKCLGARSDPMLAPRAFLKLVAGIGGFVLLRRSDIAAALGNDPLLLFVLVIASVWCAATGAVRFVLLTVGGSSALRLVNIHIQQSQTVMRPARRRAWWKFWWW